MGFQIARAGCKRLDVSKELDPLPGAGIRRVGGHYCWVTAADFGIYISKRLKLGNTVDFHAFCILGNFKSAQCKTDGWSWRFRGLNRVKAFLGSAGEFWQMRVFWCYPFEYQLCRYGRPEVAEFSNLTQYWNNFCRLKRGSVGKIGNDWQCKTRRSLLRARPALNPAAGSGARGHGGVAGSSRWQVISTPALLATVLLRHLHHLSWSSTSPMTSGHFNTCSFSNISPW